MGIIVNTMKEIGNSNNIRSSSPLQFKYKDNTNIDFPSKFSPIISQSINLTQPIVNEDSASSLFIVLIAVTYTYSCQHYSKDSDARRRVLSKSAAAWPKFAAAAAFGGVGTF